jgi:hypothetical protein
MECASLLRGISVIAGVVSVCFTGLAQTKTPATNGVSIAGKTSITTDFVQDGKLTSGEISQVLKLARQCGLSNAVKITTFYHLPTVAKGISVKGEDFIQGSNTRFDTVYIDKIGWNGKPDPTNNLIGNFGVNQKATTLLRSYELNKQQTIQVSIGEGVEIAVADKVMALFVAGELPFSSHENKDELESTFLRERLGKAKPKMIYKEESGQYAFCFDDYPITVFYFKYEKGKVTVTRSGSIWI